jgi:hypothetical protein
VFTTGQPTKKLHDLEGQQASIELSDGSRLRGTVISYGRGRVSTVWLEVDGTDTFIQHDRVVSAWGEAA